MYLLKQYCAYHAACILPQTTNTFAVFNNEMLMQLVLYSIARSVSNFLLDAVDGHEKFTGYIVRIYSKLMQKTSGFLVKLLRVSVYCR